MKVTTWFLNFHFNGRARRSHWWANAVAWLVVWVAVFVGFSVTSDPGSQNGAVPPSFAVVAIVATLALIASAIDGTAMNFRRAHDTGKSGWIWLLLLIPLVNLLPFYWLMIEDSQQGPNKYGPPVKEFYQPAVAGS